MIMASLTDHQKRHLLREQQHQLQLKIQLQQQLQENSDNSPIRKPFIYEIPSHQIGYDDQRPLGSGGFGTVFKGFWFNETATIEVAIKVFKVNEKGIKSFNNELKQLSEIKHKNIVHLYGSCRIRRNSTRELGLVMEKGEMSLSRLLHNHKTFVYNIKNACYWVYQVAEAIRYCHDIKPKPLIHRDLKPDNVLLFMGGKQVKICDFGIATFEKTIQTNEVGTYWYMAPEVFEGSFYDVKCDVFSWSIMFWEILARRRPYFDLANQCSAKIQFDISLKGVRPRSLSNCPKIVCNLIEKSWDHSPKNRPDMTRIVKEMIRFLRFAGIEKLNQTV